MPIEEKFIAAPAMGRFVGEIGPPTDRWIRDIEFVHVGDGVDRREAAVGVRRALIPRNFRSPSADTPAAPRLSEGKESPELRMDAARAVFLERRVVGLRSV